MVQLDVTADDIVRALDEFDARGREAFLARYKFGEARSYFLVRDGREYDSKAIVGAAHEVRHGEPLSASDFSGGEATVKRVLENLGFTVKVRRNPVWTRDEVILACDLVRDNDWRYLSDRDPRTIRLSGLLQRSSIHPVGGRTSTFRNPAGVARKTVDIATQHPDYRGAPTNGGQYDRSVLLEFLSEPDRMRAIAQQIRASAMNSSASVTPVPDLDHESAAEGGVLERQHLTRERDPKLRQRKIASVRKSGGLIQCEVCGFDFGQVYGDRGEDYIECHHRVPLHVSGPARTRLADLALLCSNCHRIIHRRNPWLTVEQLTEMVEAHR